jgi:hypothetical protein
VQGQWVKTLRGGRCQTIPLEKAVRIICKDRLVVRDAIGDIHTLSQQTFFGVYSLRRA